MTADNLTKTVQNIIKNNVYLTLATTDEEGPWAAPLFYCVDPQYNFYLISSPSSRHAKALLKNPQTAWAIFNSQAKEGQGNGLQIEGKAYLVNDTELDEALKYYSTTFIPCNKEYFLGYNHYKLFKLVPQKFFIGDPEVKVDTRVEVKLI